MSISITEVINTTNTLFESYNIVLPNDIMDAIIARHMDKDKPKDELSFYQNDNAYIVHAEVLSEIGLTAYALIDAETNKPVFSKTISYERLDKKKPDAPDTMNTLKDKIKTVSNGLRARKLCDALKTTKTPMEAYTLLLDFLGESGQISGTIAKKDMAMDYHFENNQESKTVTVSMNARTKNGDRLIELDINLNETNVEMFHDSMMALMNMYR